MKTVNQNLRCQEQAVQFTSSCRHAFTASWHICLGTVELLSFGMIGVDMALLWRVLLRFVGWPELAISALFS